MAQEYPLWQYYPTSVPAPGWVSKFVSVVREARLNFLYDVEPLVAAHVAIAFDDYAFAGVGLGAERSAVAPRWRRTSSICAIGWNCAIIGSSAVATGQTQT